MSTPLITLILEDLSKDFSKSSKLLEPVAIQLLAWFFIYELCASLLLAEAGTNPLTILKNKIKIWAFLYAIIYFFNNIMTLIQDMFKYFIKIATTSTPGKLEELPYKVLQLAYTALNTLLDYIKWTQPSTWVLLVGVILGLFIFAKISLTVGMVIIENMVMSSLVIILIPFMMFEKLRFVGDKVIGTLINLNMKIFVIQYLMYYFFKFLKKPLENTNGNIMSVIENSFYWIVAMAMLALVTLRGNEMAQTLISGVTNFGDSSELISMARQGAGRVLTAVKGTMAGVKIGQGAIKGASQGAFDEGVKGAIYGGGIGARISSFFGGIKGGIKGGFENYRRK